MRDHTKLRAFELADQLAVAAYELTRLFPKVNNQLSLASRLGYTNDESFAPVAEIADETCRVLSGPLKYGECVSPRSESGA